MKVALVSTTAFSECFMFVRYDCMATAMALSALPCLNQVIWLSLKVCSRSKEYVVPSGFFPSNVSDFPGAKDVNPLIEILKTQVKQSMFQSEGDLSSLSILS